MPQTSTEPYSVLFVDDEEKSLKYFEKAFSKRFALHTALSVDDAIAILDSNSSIAVVITDQRMPNRTGVSLLSFLRETRPDVIRILTTAYADLDSAIEGVNTGEIFRYITKPWNLRSLEAELSHALDFFSLRRERNQLLNEKLAAVQKLVLRERVFSIAALSAAVPQARNAAASISCLLQQSLEDDELRLEMVRQWASLAPRDHWHLPVIECQRMIALNAAMTTLRLDEAADIPKVDVRWGLADWVTHGLVGPTPAIKVVTAAVLPPTCVPVAVSEAIIRFMVCRLVAWSKQDALIEVTAEPADDGGVRISAQSTAVDTAAILNDSPIFAVPGESVSSVALQTIQMVVVAGHYGGSLALKPSNSEGKRLDLTLPSVRRVASPVLPSRWVDDLLDAYDRFMAPTFA